MATEIKDQIIQKLGTGWGIIISALTIFSIGFGAGCYVNEMLSKLESYQNRAAFNNEMIEYRTQKEKEVFELRSTINKLQSDLFNEQNKPANEKQ
jgi:lipoprotein